MRNFNHISTAAALIFLVGCQQERVGSQTTESALIASNSEVGARAIPARKSKPLIELPNLKDCATVDKEQGSIEFRICWSENLASKQEYLASIFDKAKAFVVTPNNDFLPGGESRRVKNLEQSQTYWKAFVEHQCEFISEQDGWGNAWVSHAYNVCASEAFDERIEFMRKYIKAPE